MAMGRKSRYPGRAVLDYLYNQKRYSMELIAKIFGVSREAIRLWLKRAKIPTRERVYAVRTRGKRKKVNIKAERELIKTLFPELKNFFNSKA